MNENEDLKAAAEAVTTLAREGAISARSAHETWRFVLISRGWSHGLVADPINKLHPNLVAFDNLPPAATEHAVKFGNSNYAISNDHNPISGRARSGFKK